MALGPQSMPYIMLVAEPRATGKPQSSWGPAEQPLCPLLFSLPWAGTSIRWLELWQPPWTAKPHGGAKSCIKDGGAEGSKVPGSRMAVELCAIPKQLQMSLSSAGNTSLFSLTNLFGFVVFEAKPNPAGSAGKPGIPLL